jgi:hypothetical protein
LPADDKRPTARPYGDRVGHTNCAIGFGRRTQPIGGRQPRLGEHACNIPVDRIET